MQRISPAATFAALLLAGSAQSHGPAASPDTPSEREIEFPDTATHLTLAVDLHTHSVFSDGHVWPKIRVEEALRDGLDAMAITEHLEWQPHLEDIPHPDRNRSYQDALASLPADSDLILIAGSEITRRAPHGHMNAVFIEDANTLVKIGDVPEPFDPVTYFLSNSEWPAGEAVAAANAQGAFVFWNHPWSDFDSRQTEITEFHRLSAADGKLHGIEIANGQTYSPESFQLALDHDLTLVGVSDVHNLIDWDYQPHLGGHRPVNLVFVEHRSAAAIRQALFDGRTVVWFKNLLLGRSKDLLPLIDASLDIDQVSYRGATEVLQYTIRNNSDASFELKNTSGYSLVRSHDRVVVPPHDSVEVLMRTGQRYESVEIEFEVINALTDPSTHPRIKFSLQPE